MSSIHTSPEDAVKIHHIIKSPKTIGMHYGTFPLADDGMEEPVKALREEMEREGMLVGEFMTLTEGKAIILK
jgi:N-acyl-phosphatidylethanolamine-hydrolysing phospholipase D